MPLPWHSPQRRKAPRSYARASRAGWRGLSSPARSFLHVDEQLVVEIELPDGSDAQPGDTLLIVSGKVTSILTAERTALNFLQRLCGVATLTRRFIEVANRPEMALLDTRKTTPGWRALEKAAVVCGGGVNHRMGLYDAIMIKDNHLAPFGAGGPLWMPYASPVDAFLT